MNYNSSIKCELSKILYKNFKTLNILFKISTEKISV